MTEGCGREVLLDGEPDGSAERVARAALTGCAGPGEPRVLEAVARDGAAEVLGRLLQGDARLDPTGRLGRLGAEVDGARMLAEARSTGTQFLTPDQDAWPARLRDLDGVLRQRMGGQPLGLWVRGQAGLLGSLAVAVVGSRAATAYGVAAASDLAAGLADQGVTVVSGAAYGIDAAAQRATLGLGGRTVAVVAGGVDVPYPRGNSGLLEEVARTGVVVSEAAPGTGVTRRAFLARNRVIAGLARAVVLVEAAARSGANNTVGWGIDLGRHTCAMPGPIVSALSEGPHRLIRAGHPLVCNADQVLELVAPIGERHAPEPTGEPLPWDELSPEATLVMEALPAAASTSVAELAARTGLTVALVLASLSELDSTGIVAGAGDLWRRRVS